MFGGHVGRAARHRGNGGQYAERQNTSCRDTEAGSRGNAEAQAKGKQQRQHSTEARAQEAQAATATQTRRQRLDEETQRRRMETEAEARQYAARHNTRHGDAAGTGRHKAQAQA